jgi:hypothetical protein
MKRKKTTRSNRNNRLEEAVALLMQNQATLMQNQAAFLARVSEMDRVSSERFARIEERLGRLEANMETILRVLSEHARLLEALPEAVRQKIGFKPQK